MSSPAKVFELGVGGIPTVEIDLHARVLHVTGRGHATATVPLDDLADLRVESVHPLRQRLRVETRHGSAFSLEAGFIDAATTGACLSFIRAARAL